MLAYYTIDKNNGLQEGSKEQHNWLVLDQEEHEMVEKLLTDFSLPDDIFIGADDSGEVSRIEHLKDTKLSNPISVVLLNLSSKQQSIEQRIEPISFILSDDLLITYIGKNSQFIQHLLKKDTDFYSFEQVLLLSLLTSYRHFIAGLKELKTEIDDLDAAARQTTDSKRLFQLADVDRAIIFIDHTLADQNQMLDRLWEEEALLEKVNDPALIHDVKLRQKQALKLVEIYHDLINTIGSLFASMIDNNLNHLMKYLESAALVLTIPTVIAGIWGMNTGGLPWEKSSLGFGIVMLLTVILTIFTGIYLKNKNYFK